MSGAARLHVGVDVGGTFTDVCYLDERDGTIRLEKLPTTPRDQSVAIIDGVGRVLDSIGESDSDIVAFAHGTTVATNTLIEGTGSKVGLITTAGFRDVLEIGRQRRADLYNLEEVKPPVLVPRHRRLEVRERVAADGTVLAPLDDAEIDTVIAVLAELEVEAVAVCLLHAYANPEHERRIAKRLAAALPRVFISASHEVSPEFREYERVSTTVVNAYLGPVMDRYLGNLEAKLDATRISATPYVVQSNGGVVSFTDARRYPVKTVLSGPSAGVMGGAYVARTAGRAHVATLDMGGTSADVALITDGEARVKNLVEVLGHPLRTQMIDMSTVGAGGGSIAWIDPGGRLKVGPRSAGAVPGPACYGRSDDAEPTVTDANLVLGYLGTGGLLGGTMALDRTAAVRAIRKIADPLRMTVEQAAAGIVAVANASMVNAIRLISVRKGIDLRDYTLVAFGGAGPLHASAVARELGVEDIVIPSTPGVLCALGALVTDAKRDFATTRVLPVDDSGRGPIAEVIDALEHAAEAWIEGEQSGGRAVVRRAVDMRYVGQNHELTVPLGSGVIDSESLRQLAADFHAHHRARYGYALEGEPLQAVTFRVEAVLQSERPDPREQASARTAELSPRSHRTAWFATGPEGVDVPVYWRPDLHPGDALAGPAIVEQVDTTVLVAPGDRATVDPAGNLIIATGGHRVS